VRLLFLNLNQSAGYGGVERWMLDAAAGLAARGHDAVLVGRPAAPWLRVGARLGLRVRDDHAGPWIERVWRVRAAMRAERPDVVVAKGKKAARMAAWARATGAPGRVVLFFGLTGELRPGRWLDARTWRLVDAGIVVAHGARRWYVDHGFGPPTKLHVAWKGVDLARFVEADGMRDASRHALGVAADELVVGTVGRLVWQKGVDLLCDALARVDGRLPRWRLVVVGGGRDADQIAAAAAPLGERVTLLGHREDVPALLAAMDVVVVPSRDEVMAQTTLEAMAAGRAVVSTRTIGADEAIDDGASGVLVPVRDAAALGEAIVDLARDPARRAALGAAARARVARDFAQARMLDRCEGVLRAVAAGQSALARER